MSAMPTVEKVKNSESKEENASTGVTSVSLALKVITRKGEDTGRVATLSSAVFGIVPNEQILSSDVKNIRNRARQGTTKTKTKGEVTGSTRKPFRQKGTGRAPQGSVKANLLRGGGTLFGAVLRNYGFTPNKKEKKLARRSALAVKAQKNQIVIIEDFVLEQISTKAYIAMLNELSMEQEKILWVLPAVAKKLVLSSNNVQKNKVVTVDQVNTYDLLYATKVLFFETALPSLVQKLT